MSPVTTICVVMLAGGLGAVLRYGLTEWSAKLLGTAFPYGTLLVNILGSFLIGLLYAVWWQDQWLVNSAWRAVVITGFLGALTTFSAFSLDNMIYLQHGLWTKLTINILLNVGLCVVAVASAMALVKPSV